MDQADDNSLTALLTKRDQVRFRETVNICTERRAEKRIQRTAWILSQVLRKTLCEHLNGLCPAGWLNEQSITEHWFQSVRTCLYSWATGRNSVIVRRAAKVVSFEDSNRFLGINAEVPGSGCRVLDIFHCAPGAVVCLRLGGPEARLKKGAVMTSSYSANRDKHFWSSLRYRHRRIRSWDYRMTDIAEGENANGCSWYTTLKTLKVGKIWLATHKSWAITSWHRPHFFIFAPFVLSLSAFLFTFFLSLLL